MPATSYRYLTKIPGVCGGRTIVEGTSIGVHDVMGLIVNGATVDDVVRSFPELKRSQIYECLAYYEDHRGEIDGLVTQQTRRGALEANKTPSRPLALLAGLLAELPENPAWPADGARQHDHYLYGSPKRP